MNKLKIIQIALITSVLSLSIGLIWFINSSLNQYDKVNESWSQYNESEAKIVDTLLKLNERFGYGGMIHHFKNYVIRGDDKYFALFQQDAIKIKEWAGLLDVLHDMDEEIHGLLHDDLLGDIITTVIDYEKNIKITQQMHLSNELIADIDIAVKVNDELALKSLKLLRNEIDKRSLEVQKQTSISLRQSHDFLANGQLFAIPVIMLMILLIYYIRRIQLSNDEVLKAHDWVDTLLDTAPEATVCSNTQGNIVRVNKQAEEIFGYSCEEFIGMNIDKLVPHRYSKGHPSKRATYFKHPNFRPMGEGSKLFALLKSGDELEVAISLSSAGNGLDRVAIATIRDVTELRKAERNLIYQASHDGLTGLLNRSEFEVRLKETLLRAKRYSEQHALCFLDLDQFKVVNDTSGHVAGDALLKRISVILTEHIRDTDTLARLGGDEFAIIMNNCSVDQAMSKAQEIVELIEDFKFPWEDKNYTVGVSIGLTVINVESSSSEDVLKYSDIACYAAKDAGRNRVHLYQESDEKLVLHRKEMHWLNLINEALEKGLFCLYAQEIRPTDPLAHYSNYEILIRMKNEDGDIIPPGSFLPAAERYGLISKIDLWVIDQTFRWLTKHTNQFPEKTHFSINLSGRSMGDEEILKHILNWLESELIVSSKINFEVTETMAIANLNDANHFISVIKDKGCGFSLDDFGSGLSSFGYLKKLQVDNLKIDGVFVRDILDDPIDEAMVESINNIGHVMKMKTIAEFVENEAIANKLIDMGVDYLQGYGIARPVPIEELL